MIAITIDPTVLSTAALLIAGWYSYWSLWLRPQLQAKKPFADLPMPPGSHWFSGHIHMINGSFDKEQKALVMDSADKYGHTGYWLVSRPAVSVNRWSDAKLVLRTEYARDRVPLLDKHFNRVLGSKNVLILKGREWKFHRTAIVKSFTPASLNQSRTAMETVTRTVSTSLRKCLHDATSLQRPILPLMKMITLDVFGLAAFSMDFGCTKSLQLSPVAGAFDFLVTDVGRRLSTSPFRPDNFFYSIPTNANRKSHNAKAILRTFLTQTVTDRLKPGAEPKKDLLDNILDGHEAAKKELNYGESVSDETLTDVMSTVLFAGYDTTSITLTYTLYMISQNPDVETKCLDEMYKSDTGTASDLVYCTAVIRESLRLFPPAPITTRTTQKPLTLSGDAVIPAGTNVLIPIWHLHRNEANFSRALEFLPERWVRWDGTRWVERDPKDTDGPVPAGNPDAFFAFSSGGRNCPGSKFAWQEAIVVLSGLLKSFKFAAIPTYILESKREGLIQNPKLGLPMEIFLREG